MISEYESVYKVITPAGGFDAVFGEDDAPVLYRGDDAAIQFFKNWLSLNQISGEYGVLINADRITPTELYGFCQPPGSGIIVVAPLNDMFDYAEQDEIESDDNEGNEAMTSIAIDSTVPFDEHDCEILIVLDDEEALLLDSAHWVTTKTGSHLLIEGGTIVGGAGGKLNGTKVMTKKMLKDKEDDDTFVRREYNEEHDFGARLHGGPDGKKNAENHAERLTRILGRKFTTQKEGTHVFYGFDNKRYDLHRAVPQDKAALDSATGIEKIRLVKELSGIRETMKAVTSGIDKLKMVKRVGEIRALLGVKGNKSDDGSASVVIATFKDEEDNIEVRVAKITNGYSVTLKDLYSGEVLPSGMIYPDEETAIQKAKEIAKVDQKQNTQATIADVENNLPILRRFIGKSQLSVMLSSAKGEEGQFFIDKLIEMANTFSTMPKTYEQDGKGDEAVVYLHYFKGSADWYITERDMEDEQLQAFGLADLFGDGGEVGYISIDELIASGVELDLYWQPKTLKEIKSGSGASDKGENDEDGLDHHELFPMTANLFGNPITFNSPVLPLKNKYGEVKVGDTVEMIIYVTEAFKKIGVRKISTLNITREMHPQNGDVLSVIANGSNRLFIKLEGKPELEELWNNYVAINDAFQSANNARKAEIKEKEASIDNAALAAMNLRAEELRNQIPPGSIEVNVKQSGSLDGDPIYVYAAQGVGLNLSDIAVVGTASAIRPGALGSFADVVVAYTTQDKIDARKKIMNEKVASNAAKELRETAVPPKAVSDYDRYNGNPDSAWEASDELAWANINKWSPYIEAQRGSGGLIGANQSTDNPDATASVDTVKSGFTVELEALKSETDITAFGDKLDEIAARIEQAGLVAELDAELNSAADVLTGLMAAKENAEIHDIVQQPQFNFDQFYAEIKNSIRANLFGVDFSDRANGDKAISKTIGSVDVSQLTPDQRKKVDDVLKSIVDSEFGAYRKRADYQSESDSIRIVARGLMDDNDISKSGKALLEKVLKSSGIINSDEIDKVKKLQEKSTSSKAGNKKTSAATEDEAYRMGFDLPTYDPKTNRWYDSEV